MSRKDERPWELEVILRQTERAQFRLECKKITANKVIDNLFSSVFNIIFLINPQFHKYMLLRLISLSLAKFAGFVCPLSLFASGVVVPVCNLTHDSKKSKSIKVDNHKNCVMDFYRHPIFVDWLVSNLIDNDRLLSTIEIIDMVPPVYLLLPVYVSRSVSPHFGVSTQAIRAGSHFDICKSTSINMSIRKIRKIWVSRGYW